MMNFLTAQQQMAMQQLQLEIAKLEAEVMKLQSEAQMNMAKAQDTASKPEINIADIKSKLEMKQRELDLRRELASMTNSTRQNQSQTQAAAKLATTAMTSASRAGGPPQQMPGPVNIDNLN